MRSSLNVTLGFNLASISTGLVKLIDDDDSVNFRTLHAACSTPVKEKKWCPTCDVEVPLEDQLKGFEVSKAEMVLFTPDELSAAKPISDGVVKLTKFVNEETMPEPHMWLRHYIVIPDGSHADRYWSLMDVLVATGMVGVGQSVLWAKKRSCVLRPDRFGRCLLLSTVNQSNPKVPDFDPVPYDEDLFDMTRDVVLRMADPLKPSDMFVQDPVRLLVETRMGVKRRREADLKVAPVSDYQQQLKASLKPKKAKAKR